MRKGVLVPFSFYVMNFIASSILSTGTSDVVDSSFTLTDFTEPLFNCMLHQQHIHIYINVSSLCSLTSFCELVSSLLQQAKDTAQNLDHLPEGILEVSPPFLWCSMYLSWFSLAATSRKQL